MTSKVKNVIYFETMRVRGSVDMEMDAQLCVVLPRRSPLCSGHK